MTVKNNSDNTIKPNNKGVFKTIIGVISLVLGFVLLFSFISFITYGKIDQSQISSLLNKEIEAENIFGKAGAFLSEFFIHKGIGIVVFFLPVFMILLGVKILFQIQIIKPFKLLYKSVFFLIWIPIFFGCILPENDLYSGVMGFETNDYLNSLIGKLGVGVALAISMLIYIITQFKITPDKLKIHFKKEEKIIIEDDDAKKEFPSKLDTEKPFPKDEISKPLSNKKTEKHQNDDEFSDVKDEELGDFKLHSNPQVQQLATEAKEELTLTIEEFAEEEVLDKLASELVAKHGEYDPTLDLPGYQFPPLSLLTKYETGQNTTVDQRELERNKNRIIETLANYGIGISQIKATIGPTVTLYEIVPDAGVRISKIKNLEDDIALSLSALGIRIVAPIPGRGTIGIEVPNSHTSVVSMHSVIASHKFQTAKMDLPIAFGKTISNETFVADLAKMPHLLMAGATGQGKSVGLNAIMVSLLYKKHPSELKFVLVDPKKVELTLYSKIERHYLAKLPDAEEAIITDNKKVINTLNSLCIEMDDRYELLKNAFVRNIKEYNVKFKERKLNPEAGHKFLPYIVLIVDEFADLIMTAGKEVEMPIARLAQLARAVGIHLIIATQRPSVNVITGMIKANFPGRVAFRVISKIDSRTILDSSGADQLIGKGDMLFTTGNEVVRLQCAFVDTPEVAKITEFIGSQKGYVDAMHLPEYEGEENSSLDIDLDERDALFEDAARVIVSSQQGSASLLQRKLKLGYNRAGRIIDQLEAAGVVGPFEGSKPRQVLIMDLSSLEQLLNNLP